MAFNNVFQNKKIIVTGNTGFKGTWLSLWLHRLGAEVVGLSVDIPTKPSLFEVLGMEEKIRHEYMDIRDKKAVLDLFNDIKPDFVFHLAAQPIVSVSYLDPVATFETNVIGTANILEALRVLNHPCNAVMITSDKCYDNVEWIWGYRESDALGGKDPYSASKGAAELVIKTYVSSYFSKPDSNVKVVAVRAGNVIGGGDWALNRIVPDSFRAWSLNEAVRIRNPKSTRPWQHVLEPLSGYLRVAQSLKEATVNLNGEPFNFGPNADQNHTVLELLNEVSKYWIFSKDGERFEVEKSLNSFHEAGLLKLNCDKALHFLQWKPVLEFHETASFTGQWYNAYYNTEDVDIFDFTIQQIEEYQSKAFQKKLSWTL
jgi:CDP-glucose 4,6-dehydratase